MILSETRIKNMKRGKFYIMFTVVHCCFCEWFRVVDN